MSCLLSSSLSFVCVLHDSKNEKYMQFTFSLFSFTHTHTHSLKIVSFLSRLSFALRDRTNHHKNYLINIQQKTNMYKNLGGLLSCHSRRGRRRRRGSNRGDRRRSNRCRRRRGRHLLLILLDKCPAEGGQTVALRSIGIAQVVLDFRGLCVYVYVCVCVCMWI